MFPNVFHLSSQSKVCVMQVHVIIMACLHSDGQNRGIHEIVGYS